MIGLCVARLGAPVREEPCVASLKCSTVIISERILPLDASSRGMQAAPLRHWLKFACGQREVCWNPSAFQGPCITSVS